MKLHSSVKQCIVFLLAFLMAFEPFAVNMVYASSADPKDGLDQIEKAEVQEESSLGKNGITSEDGFEDLSILKPGDYLEYIYNLRGRSVTDDAKKAREQEKALAWGEWMNSISGAYSLMDDGCTDVFTFYDAMGEACNKTSDLMIEAGKAEAYVTCLKYAANKACLAGAFLAKITRLDKLGTKIANWVKGKDCLMKGFAGMGNLYHKAASCKLVKNTGVFLEHMSPPVGFSKGCKPGEGFAAYWRWVKKSNNATSSGAKAAETIANNSRMTWNQFQHANAGKGLSKADMSKAWADYKASNPTTTTTTAGTDVPGMSTAQGVAHTVGIGLTILGIALDGYAIYQDIKDGDYAGGYRWTYDNVKNNVSLALGVASLVAMFCIPVVGQVIGIIALVWTCLTIIGDELGKYNKRWKEAYKNSYWFLYENDPQFKSYYDNRDDLIDDEKSAAYIITERNYASFKQNARNHEKDYKGQNDYYDKNDQEAISARVYIELEKQGVVTSYYNRSSFKMPDYSMNRLLEMWQSKADYMAWKPTEEESVRAENRGFWGKVGHALNPMTYISWAGDKINSVKYNNFSKYNIEKVYFNPDFVLMKKYQTWITANRKMVDDSVEGNNNDFYRAIGLRIEQSPFNYIPLVGIDMAAWSDELLEEAFNCDAFFVGIKEMMYFKNLVEDATEKVKEGTKETTKTVLAMKDAVEFFNKRAKILSDLQRRYDLSPTSESEGKDFFKDNKSDLKDTFGWKKDAVGDKVTPETIMKVFWNDINTALSLDPIAVGQKAVDCKLLLDTIQRNMDNAVLMEQLYNEKKDALDNFDNEFKNYEFKRYLKENQFLDVDGGGFMDWLSGLKPAWDELNKYNNLYKKKIDEFQEAVNDSNTGHDKWWFITYKSDENHPSKVLETLKATLSSYQKVSEYYESISANLEKDSLYLSPSDKSVYEIEALKEENLPKLDSEDLISSNGEISTIDMSLIPMGDEEFDD